VGDYYSILSKAVSALDPDTASARQRLYERARSAMSAELERVSPPFDSSEIAATKLAFECAILKVEAEATHQHSASASDYRTTADLSDTACPPLYRADIGVTQGQEGKCDRIEPEAIGAFEQQPEPLAVCANDCLTGRDLLAEIDGACPPLDDKHSLESAAERIGADPIPDWLEQLEPATGANTYHAAVEGPTEIDGTFPTFHGSNIASPPRPESPTERIETEAIPEWLRQPERVQADECPPIVADQNEVSPGPLKKLWTRVSRRTAGPHTPPVGQDICLTDEQDFAPKRARTAVDATPRLHRTKHWT
jgi:hypothetical protein